MLYYIGVTIVAISFIVLIIVLNTIPMYYLMDDMKRTRVSIYAAMIAVLTMLISAGVLL
jgi:hypothetical protein